MSVEKKSEELRDQIRQVLNPPREGGTELGWIKHFKVLRFIGQGVTGLVFDVEDENNGQRAALKLLHVHWATDNNTRERFIREVETMSKLMHPRFVRVYESGAHKQPSNPNLDLPFFTMELLEGKTLEQHLEESAGHLLPPSEVARIGQEVAEGLVELSRLGLVHRDVKPSNIWLKGSNQTTLSKEKWNLESVVLLDVGVAFNPALTRLTNPGVFVGTPNYASPETLSGKLPTPASDQYSLGCVLYEACVGKRPFEGNNLVALLATIIKGDLVPPAHTNSRIPSCLSDVIVTLLAKAPEQRFAKASLLLAQLILCVEKLGSQGPDSSIPIPDGISKANSSVPMYLAWNPQVYGLFDDALTYYLITTTTFKRKTFFSQLKDCLKKHQYQAYRIYQVFGSYDVILRVWVKHGKQAELRNIMEEEVDSIREASPWIVWRIRDHWYWGGDPLDTKTLYKITPDYVRQLQKFFGKPESWDSPLVSEALQQRILRKIEGTNDRILFFTFVDFKGGIVNLEEARNEIIEDLQSRQSILCPALYQTTNHPIALLLKGEARDLFSIGRLVTDLMSRLAIMGAKTATLVACDTDIHGNEEITARDIKQAAGIDLAVRRVLPELYDKEITDAVRHRLEHGVREILVLGNELPEIELTQVMDCIAALIPEADMDPGFEMTRRVASIFGDAESKLRKPSIRFLAGVLGQSKLQATIDEALKNTKTSEQDRKPDFLALGNRLTVICHVIKELRLSDDQDLIASWSEFANLRNVAAHHAKDLSKEWEKTMVIVVTFLNRFQKLMRFLRENVDKSA